MSITLPDGTVLDLEQAPKPLRLWPAHGGAKIELAMRACANQPGGPASRLEAVLAAGLPPGNDLREVCRLTAENTLVPAPRALAVKFVGHISEQALAAIEEVRRGGALWLMLRSIRAITIGAEPAGVIAASGGDELVELLAEEWASQLEKVTAASYLTLQIPITAEPGLATAAERLRTARAYITGGTFNAVAGELRQVLELVRLAYRTRATAAAAPSAVTERSSQERWAVLVEARFAWLSAFEHDDSEPIKGCTMDRAEAIDALFDVAGKLQRLATDRRGGLV